MVYNGDMKILISGGHLTPALAMIDFIKKNHSQDELVFVGRRYSQSKLKQKAIEFEEVKSRQVKFIFFDAPRLGFESLISFLKKAFFFSQSLIKANQIFKQEKPDVFLSFGGYLAVPMAVVAKFRNIPIVTHEQTLVLGKANQFIARLADKVAVSFDKSKTFVSNQNKIVLTGNPLRENVFAKAAQPAWFKASNKKPILLVMGGNQGSLALNEFIKSNLLALSKRFVIVHQCGRDNLQNKYQQELETHAQELLGKAQQDYYSLPWIEEQDLAWLYQHSFVALSRAGANTILELVKANLPMILVPLPTAHHDEQVQNSVWAKNQQVAEYILQDKLSLETFQACLDKIEENYNQYKSNFKKIDLADHASDNLYKLIEDVSQKKLK